MKEQLLPRLQERRGKRESSLAHHPSLILSLRQQSITITHTQCVCIYMYTLYCVCACELNTISSFSLEYCRLVIFFFLLLELFTISSSGTGSAQEMDSTKEEEEDDRLHSWPPKASINKTGGRSTGACRVCRCLLDHVTGRGETDCCSDLNTEIQ